MGISSHAHTPRLVVTGELLGLLASKKKKIKERQRERKGEGRKRERERRKKETKPSQKQVNKRS